MSGEADLVARARDGDRGAFEELVRESFGPLVRFCGSLARHEDRALDLAQEALLRALRGISGFRGGATFRTWVMTIARNLYLNERMRRGPAREGRGREGAGAGAIEERPDRRGEDPGDAAARRELEERLERAIELLPEEQRVALLHCDREGLSYREIADIMETPLGTVMSRIHYARKKLREVLT